MALGRPRDFDTDKALESALRVFWEKGYEGASLSDLTGAMGINRPSLYAAFGNKEQLFRKALDRYSESACFISNALKELTAYKVAETFLYSVAESQTDPKQPRGCLMVTGALACGEEADVIRKELIARREAGMVALRNRLERAKEEGDLPSGANPEDLARFLSTISQGMSVQAAGGASRKELQQVAETALRAWPKRQTVTHEPAPPVLPYNRS